VFHVKDNLPSQVHVGGGVLTPKTSSHGYATALHNYNYYCTTIKIIIITIIIIIVLVIMIIF
jgi:hypothetical protein